MRLAMMVLEEEKSRDKEEAQQRERDLLQQIYELQEKVARLEAVNHELTSPM